MKEVDPATFPNLNSRGFAFLGGRGSGKTTAITRFFNSTGIGILAIDPVGELGNRLASRDDVLVYDVPPEFESDPKILPGLIRALQAGQRVVTVAARPFSLAPRWCDAVTAAVWDAQVRDLLFIFEEAQRVVGQNRVDQSDNARAEIEQGRNFRRGFVLASQRPASIDKEALARADSFYIGRMTYPNDMRVVDELLSMKYADRRIREQAMRAMQDFQPGTFLPIEPAAPPTVNQ